MAGLKPTAQLLVGRRSSSDMLSVDLLCASVSTHFCKKIHNHLPYSGD